MVILTAPHGQTSLLYYTSVITLYIMDVEERRQKCWNKILEEKNISKQHQSVLTRMEI